MVTRHGWSQKVVVMVVTAWMCASAQAELKDRVKGLWDFENLSLSASVGNDLVFAGNASATTEFNTTTGFGIPDIGGIPAKVMHFPAYTNPADGIKIYPGIEANGGGVYVNLYTLLMDIFYPASSDGLYRALFQTNDTNANDADFFVGDAFTGPDPNGIGANFTYHGTILPNTWYRIAFVVDSRNDYPRIDKYVNGTFVGTSDIDGLDGTWTLYTASQGNPSWLFSDESGDVAEGYVNSIAILDGTATAEEIQSLGQATASGLFPVFAPPTPGPTPTPTMTGTPTATPNPLEIPCHSGGVWEFDGNLTATVGRDLEFSGDAANTSSFGTTTSFGIPDINGVPAYVLHFPAYPSSTDGIKVYPEIEANGGGAYVNLYSLVMDILYPEISNNIWRALFQTSGSNNNDADFYVGDGGVSPSPNGIGISGVYHGTIVPNTWHRIGFSVDLTRSKMDKYIDGIYVGTTNLGSGVDGRWSLYTKSDNVPSWLLSDESGDTGEGYINSFVITDCAMLPDDFAALGAADADGIGIITLRDNTNVHEWSQY